MGLTLESANLDFTLAYAAAARAAGDEATAAVLAEVHRDEVRHVRFAARWLPRLAPGVYVHVHDIAYPFEYQRHWVYEGRAWNEAYLVRAFLQFNAAFTVECFNSYLGRFHPDALAAAMPLATRNPGTSLWLRRRGGDA